MGQVSLFRAARRLCNEIGCPERSVTWLTEEVLGNVESLRAVTAEVLGALCSEERNWELPGLLAVLKV